MNPTEENKLKEAASGPLNSAETGTAQSGTAAGLNELALLNFKQGKYRESEALFMQAIAINQKLAEGGQSELSTSLRNLAALYFEQEKFIQAEANVKRALVVAEKDLGHDHPDIAEGLILYAKILRQIHFNYKAAQLESRAKSILKNKPDSQPM
jgi:tetratricopeptide (TPR) repeat protein